MRFVPLVTCSSWRMRGLTARHDTSRASRCGSRGCCGGATTSRSRRPTRWPTSTGCSRCTGARQAVRRPSEQGARARGDVAREVSVEGHTLRYLVSYRGLTHGPGRAGGRPAVLWGFRVAAGGPSGKPGPGPIGFGAKRFGLTPFTPPRRDPVLSHDETHTLAGARAGLMDGGLRAG